MDILEPFIFDARIKTPFNMIISGPSGCGKSSFLVNLLIEANSLIDKEFDYIVWFAGQSTPLLKSLENEFKEKITVVDYLPNDFSQFMIENKSSFFIFDDLLTESSNSQSLINLFTRGGHHNDISIALCLQDFFYNGKARKTIVRNSHYIVLFQNPLDRTIENSLSFRVYPKRPKTFIEIFEDATSEPYSYLFLDGKQSSFKTELKFRTDIFGGKQYIYIPK